VDTILAALLATTLAGAFTALGWCVSCLLKTARRVRLHDYLLRQIARREGLADFYDSYDQDDGH
jgi:hypothetical protein